MESGCLVARSSFRTLRGHRPPDLPRMRPDYVSRSGVITQLTDQRPCSPFKQTIPALRNRTAWISGSPVTRNPVSRLRKGRCPTNIEFASSVSAIRPTGLTSSSWAESGTGDYAASRIQMFSQDLSCLLRSEFPAVMNLLDANTCFTCPHGNSSDYLGALGSQRTLWIVSLIHSLAVLHQEEFHRNHRTYTVLLGNFVLQSTGL